MGIKKGVSMDYKLLIVARVVSVLLCIYIVNRAKKNALIEKESFFWLISSFIMVYVSFMPNSLDVISNMIGIKYPPATLFLISTIVLVILLFRQYGKTSLLTYKVNDLIRTVGLLSYEIDKMKNEKKRSINEYENKKEHQVNK